MYLLRHIILSILVPIKDSTITVVCQLRPVYPGI